MNCNLLEYAEVILTHLAVMKKIILASSLASCVSLCKLLDFSGSQFLLLGLVVYNKDLVTLQHLEGHEGQYMI